MSIEELCDGYDREQNPEKKEELKKAIIKYCNDNQDEIIPDTAKKVYVSYLCGF